MTPISDADLDAWERKASTVWREPLYVRDQVVLQLIAEVRRLRKELEGKR